MLLGSWTVIVPATMTAYAVLQVCATLVSGLTELRSLRKRAEADLPNGSFLCPV
ncbi:MAG TPA: hypothetical protein VLJ11_12880 [Bryobacteraceae bacterium]|nr:hypothetical protein [Bryobacteraceae bacterium]